MRSFAKLFAVSALALLFPLGSAHAQVPSAQPVFPVGKAIVKTLTANPVGTINLPDIYMAGWQHILCMFGQSAHTGSPTTTITIYNKDTATAAYVSVLASAGYTSDAEQAAFQVFPGAPTTSNVSANASLSQVVRVAIVVTGSGTSTGGLACYVY